MTQEEADLQEAKLRQEIHDSFANLRSNLDDPGANLRYANAITAYVQFCQEDTMRIIEEERVKMDGRKR